MGLLRCGGFKDLLVVQTLSQLQLPPVVERELRIALRKHGAIHSRFRMALAGVCLVSLFLLFGLLVGPGSWGRTLHYILFVWAMGRAALPAMNLSVGLFSEERRNQTLELLYLTGMGSGELFIGKLLGAVVIASSDLLALAPLLAVPFLSGGITGDLFVATATCLPTVLLFMVSVGLLASAICQDEGAALVLALTITGLLCIAVPLPFTVGQWLTGQPPFSTSWLSLSPALGPYLVLARTRSFPAADFWTSTAVAWGCSAAFLALAAAALNCNWRNDLDRNVKPTGWRGRWDALIRGQEAWRVNLRSRVLGASPFQWLVQRDRRPVLLAWSLMGGFSGLWLLGWWAWPVYWLSALNLYFGASLLVIGVGCLMRYATARRLAEDRREGVLELLLTTPLSPAQMMEGQAEALKEQFRPARLALLGLFVLMMAAGLWARTWNQQALITYVILWCFFLHWCLRSGSNGVPRTMWIALNSARPMFGLLGSRNGMVSWLWILFNLRNVGRAFAGGSRGFPTGSDAELVVVVVVAVCFGLFQLAKLASRYRRGLIRSDRWDGIREKFIAQIRFIAQEPPPEPRDPRFKQWKDWTQRFPPSPFAPPPFAGFPTLPRTLRDRDRRLP